jgi:putative membrane protein
MKTTFRTAVAAAALLIAAPSIAQMSSPTATSGMMSATDVGVSPLTGTSATDYVKLAADSDNFEIQSGRIAAMKAHRKDVKSFGSQMISDHSGTTKSLMAALNNKDRKIVPPSTKLSAANEAKIDLLRKAPKNSFDQIYLTQQLEAHQNAWALHKGYATDGTDASLKQVASTAVPVVESHLSMLKSMNTGM